MALRQGQGQRSLATNGSQVLLQMNVAYYLPSIPLLLVSFFLDDPLDRAFGAGSSGLHPCHVLS